MGVPALGGEPVPGYGTEKLGHGHAGQNPAGPSAQIAGQEASFAAQNLQGYADPGYQPIYTSVPVVHSAMYDLPNYPMPGWDPSWRSDATKEPTPPEVEIVPTQTERAIEIED